MSRNAYDDQFDDAAEEDDYEHVEYEKEARWSPEGMKAPTSRSMKGKAKRSASEALKKSKIAKQQAAAALMKTATDAMAPPPPSKKRAATTSPPKRQSKQFKPSGLLYTKNAKHLTRQHPAPTEAEECHVNCIPTYAVHKASRLVAQNLRLFPEASPGVHLQAAVAIETFGKQVFLPYILAARSVKEQEQQSLSNRNHTTLILDDDRIFYATLMALREVLAQNAHTFFQLSTPSEETSLENIADNEEEQVYAKLLMATTIVIAACMAADKDVETLMETVKEGEMPAPRARSSSYCKTPDNKIKQRQDALTWKVGYNVAHTMRSKRHETDHRVSLPKPTAVYMSIVEQIPAAIKKSNAHEW
mmetsp:Transcript_16650/g.27599  ORF Transcript_16650/g.27599 Transcript_16650/m.27599 type:complete len:360 (-) Transcript_16650:1677-2756(-)